MLHLHALLVVLLTVVTDLGGLNLLLVVLTGLASAAVVGVLKKFDTRITAKLGNLTPILVTLVNIALPFLFRALHFPLADIPDAAVFVNAPLATSVSVFARELAVMLKARYGSSE